MLHSFFSYSQAVSYTMVLKNPCDGKVSPNFLFHLTKDGKAYNPLDTLGTLVLPDTGRYVVNSLQIPEQYVVHLKKYKPYIDTLSAKGIEECLEPVSHPSFIGYCCCMQECEGYQEDYYINGKVRVAGTFKKGHPVGELVYYYPSGLKKEKYLYDKLGRGRIKRKTFYGENARIEKVEK